MSISTTTRRANVDETAAEMDRRGAVIESLEADIERLRGVIAATRATLEAALPSLHGSVEAIAKVQILACSTALRSTEPETIPASVMETGRG